MESSRNSVEPFETLPRPGPSHTPRRTSTTPQPVQNLVQQWWNPGRTLAELLWNLLKPPGTTPQPLQNLVEHWWNPGGETWWNLTSVELWRNYLKPPLQNLVKLWWNLVEPSCSLTLNLAEPWWNLTSNHPGPPRSPRRTWWDHPGPYLG